MHDVEIEGGDQRSLQNRADAPDDDEVDPLLRQDLQKSEEVSTAIVGSRWTYQVADTTLGVPNPIFPERTDSIATTAEFDEGAYAAVVTPGDPPDTTWLRQDGQRLYLRPSIPVELPDDPEFAGLIAALRESLPWLLADFTSAPGTLWELLRLADTLLLPIGPQADQTETIRREIHVKDGVGVVR